MSEMITNKAFFSVHCKTKWLTSEQLLPHIFSLIINIRAVNMLTGKRNHLASFVHNAHNDKNIPLIRCHIQLPGNVCKAGAWRKQVEHKNSFLAKLYKTSACVHAPVLEPSVSGCLVCVCHVHAPSPLAVVVAEVLIDWGFQLKELLLHCGPDGSLNYPEQTQRKHQGLYVYSHHFTVWWCITYGWKVASSLLNFW